jgi:hypothetical protein
MSRILRKRPSPALAVAVAAMVVAVAGVAVAGPVAHQSIGKAKVKKIARNIAGQEIAKSALPKTAVRTATIASNGTLLSGQGITQANVSRASTGVYCINGLSPGIKDAIVTLDFGETVFKTQVFITVGGGDGNCAGKQLLITTHDAANANIDARTHVAVFSG